MTSDDVRDEELRRLATEVITELRESLRAANAESVTRGQQLMEDVLGERPTHRESAYEVWTRLENDQGAMVQGDYALLRAGLGRRTSTGGPLLDMGLTIDPVEGGLLVSGQPLRSSVGLVVRWADDSGEPHEQVVPHMLGDTNHILGLDDGLADVALRVISYSATSVTGLGVWEPVYTIVTSE